MPQFFIYLLKVNIALCFFYAVYYVVLRKLTFYVLNRWFLLSAIFISSIFPVLPYHYFFSSSTLIQQNNLLQYSPNWQQIKIVLASTQGYTSNWQLLYVVYWLGVFVMLIVFIAQLLSLLQLHNSTLKANQQFRQTHKNIAPFSFFKNIYLNPTKHNTQALQSILLHEKVHVAQWHTIDLILAEFNKIFYWFNPGVWLLKNAIKQNIEFIADKKVLQAGVSAKQYQYELLHVITGTHTATAIATHFSFIHLKNRITMMNKQHSSKWSKLKYLLIIPIVGMVALVTAQKITKPLPIINTTQVNNTDDFFTKVQATVGNSTKPIWIIDGRAVIVGNGVMAAFDAAEMAIDADFKIWVAGKLYTMQQANETFNKFNIKGVGACPKIYAKQQYAINQNLLIVNQQDVHVSNTNSEQNNEDYRIEFITTNGITYAIAINKAGKEVSRFNITNGRDKDRKVWEEKYGKIPKLPPPPPAIEAPTTLPAVPLPPPNQPTVDNVDIENKKNIIIITQNPKPYDSLKNNLKKYFVDGKELTAKELSALKPNDIKTIYVNKNKLGVEFINIETKKKVYKFL